MSTAFVGNAALIVRINRASVLRLVKERGPISRAEIAEVLALNPATVGRIIGHLLQHHLLIDIGAAPSRGGRRATLLQYNHKAGTVVGVDLNGTCLAGALADLGGDFIRRTERPVSATRDPDENLARTIALIGDLLDSEPAARQSTRALGVAAPSVVRNPEGVVTLAAALGWRHLPLKALLEKHFGYPVFVQNESDLGALAESVWGVGRQFERLVWLNVGLGIGSGIVIGGRLYQGEHQAAGEVGCIPPNIGFLGRVFDTFGSMELQASGAAILDKAQRAIGNGATGPLADQAARAPLKLDDLYEAARQGDALAVRLLDELSDYLSLIIVNIISILDPALVVLAQDLATGHDVLLPRIEARVSGLVSAMPKIVPSGLKPDAILQGAVALALQATEEQFYFSHSAFGDALGR